MKTFIIVIGGALMALLAGGCAESSWSDQAGHLAAAANFFAFQSGPEVYVVADGDGSPGMNYSLQPEAGAPEPTYLLMEKQVTDYAQPGVKHYTLAMKLYSPVRMSQVFVRTQAGLYMVPVAHMAQAPIGAATMPATLPATQGR